MEGGGRGLPSSLMCEIELERLWPSPVARAPLSSSSDFQNTTAGICAEAFYTQKKQTQIVRNSAYGSSTTAALGGI